MGDATQLFHSIAREAINMNAHAHHSALRRQRLRLARYLRLIACLRAQIDEVRAEVAGLESIIDAQAHTISALRRQLQELKK